MGKSCRRPNSKKKRFGKKKTRNLRILANTATKLLISLITLTNMQKPKLQVDARVSVFWTENESYDGVITKVYRDKKEWWYRVHFDGYDASEIRDVLQHRLTLLS